MSRWASSCCLFQVSLMLFFVFAVIMDRKMGTSERERREAFF